MMENKQNFGIENDILKKYKGPGGTVTIPKGVTRIGEGAFTGCTGLTSVIIPEGVTKIGWKAFKDCTGLTSVIIPEGVTEIRWMAFEGCTDLTNVIIPKSVVKIVKSVFRGCRPALIAPHIPITNFDREDKPGACCGFAKKYLEKAEQDTELQAGYFKYIKGQKKRLYPHAVRHEELLQLMFAEKMVPRQDIDQLLDACDRQNNIIAKAAVLEYACRNFQPVDPLADFEKEMKKEERRAKQIEKTGRLPAGELKKIWSPKRRKNGTLEITSYKGTDTEVIIPAMIGKTAVSAICKEAFSPSAPCLTREQRQTRKGLTSVIIPVGITEIGGSVFYGCIGLTSVTIPVGVTKIGSSAFTGCTGLTSMTIPVGVTEIGEYAFCCCTGLTSVTIPVGVTRIGEGVFAGCKDLASVTVPKSVTEIGEHAFCNCTGLTSVAIPVGVTELGEGAFAGCKGLTIHAFADSAAEQYAKENNIPFEAL